MTTPNQFLKFQDQYPLKARKSENKTIRQKYPSSVPVILWIDKAKSKYRRKYLVSSDLTVSNLMTYFRSKQTIKSCDGHYLMVNDSMIPNMSMTMGQLDQECKSEDGFLYVSLFQESVFG